MNMNLMDQKIYPNFKYYIKNDLPKVHNIPKIANALLKNGEIKKNTLRVVLRWGFQPTIKIVIMPKN